MSLVPLKTNATPNSAVFAPASGGGGGGGVGPVLTVSTLTASTIQSGVLFLENINAVGQYPYRMRANSGTAFIENSATGEPGDLTVSTLTVSSINGQVPGGGGVGPNPAFSTIAVSSIGTGVDKGNLWITDYLRTTNAVDVGGGLTLTSPGDIILNGGQVAFTGGTGNLSGLSTINGSVYPPPPAPSGFSNTNITVAGGSTVLADNNQHNISSDFTLTANHAYNLSGFIYAIPSPNCSSNAQLIFEIGNNIHEYSQPFNAYVYSAGSGAAFGNNMDVDITWVQGTSGSAPAANRLYMRMYDPLGAAVSTFVNSASVLNLLDMGPVQGI